MGASFTNIVLRGPSQSEVADALRSLNRSAFISGTDNGHTAVFDEQCEEQSDSLVDLTKALSKKLQCAALAVLVHDSDVLLLSLFQSGEGDGAYNSAPSYFDPDGDPNELPDGGDAAQFCRAMGAGDPVVVEALLRAGSDSEYIFAESRLAALVSALELPEFVARLGFSYLRDVAEQPALDPSVDLSGMMRTTAAN